MTDLAIARLDASAPDFRARLADLLAFNDATDSAVVAPSPRSSPR